MAGRPTEYGDKILKQTNQYIDSCTDKLVRKRLKVKLPTIEGLAYYLHIHKDTVYTWRKEHPEFSDLIERLLQKQAQELINMGLSGHYNPTISKVLLTKHGYTDKQEIDHTTKGEKIEQAPPVNVYNTSPPMAASEDTIDGTNV